MFQVTTFALHPNPKHSSPYFTLTLLACLLLLLFLSACKSASTPTQPQSQAQPQSQPAKPSTPQADQQNPNTVTSSGARSNEEIIGDFDAELDASIAVFDGMILEERAKAEAIEASLGGGDEGGEQGGGGGTGGEGDLFEDGDIYEGVPGYGEFPSDEEGSEGEEQQAGGESTASADGSDSEGGGDSPSGPETTRRGGIPEDIEGGSDDDIVARQIREAALKEKDPVLREKLWDEYRKYKNQQ